MSRKFYKDKKRVVWCRVCKGRDEITRWTGGLCNMHYERFLYLSYKKWFSGLTPEHAARRKSALYKHWLAWAEANKERRRKIALESYHRRKNVYKPRRSVYKAMKRSERLKALGVKPNLKLF